MNKKINLEPPKFQGKKFQNYLPKIQPPPNKVQSTIKQTIDLNNSDYHNNFCYSLIQQKNSLRHSSSDKFRCKSVTSCRSNSKNTYLDNVAKLGVVTYVTTPTSKDNTDFFRPETSFNYPSNNRIHRMPIKAVYSTKADKPRTPDQVK